MTLLAAADAAYEVGQPPFAVLPREGTWVIGPKGVLTVDIPLEWEGTIPPGGGRRPQSSGREPVAVMTSPTTSRSARPAQCGGFYDCSTASQTAAGPKSLAEWTFNDPQQQLEFPDISVVDGVNLNMDIEPIGPHSEHMPVDPLLVGSSADEMWRGSARRPLVSADSFQLRREQLTSHLHPGERGRGRCRGLLLELRAVQVPDRPIEPATPTPLRTSRATTGNRSAAVPEGDPYPSDVACTSNADCPQNGVCWNRVLPEQGNCFTCMHDGGGPACCAPTAFNKHPTCPPDRVRTRTRRKPRRQPPFGLCSELTDATGDPDDCIGDDTFHYVMP